VRGDWGWDRGGGREKGGKMNQALYAHMNKRKKVTEKKKRQYKIQLNPGERNKKSVD
jgi:hypothetical protein